MFTPTEQNVPGNTPYIDPLQAQFLTNGQMQYMPQAQFMTPSSYGAFRTMPTPESATAPNEGGFLHNLNVANRGKLLFGWLPEYTINTFNPAVSARQHQLYAQRRVQDAKDTAFAGAIGVAGEAGIGIAGMFAPQLALPVMALSMAGLDLSKPVKERLRTTREIQDISTRKIVGGADVDQKLGYGFNDRAARSIDKYIRKEAANDRIYDKGDWQELLKLGTQFGQFDYANNAEQYKRILKNMRNSMSVMMEVLGSSDFKDVMENMKRMRDMGATMERYNQIAVEEQAYSRTMGLSHQEAVNTYGKAGAVAYQQHGLSAMQGSLQSMANAANVTYLQRTGVLDPITVAQFGGISGMTQQLTEQGATAHAELKKYILPALMNEDMTDLRTDIDFKKLAKDPMAFGKLIAQTAQRKYTKEQYAEFEASADKSWTKLGNILGTEGQDDLLMNSAHALGVRMGYTGDMATRTGLRQMGHSPEAAKVKTEAYYSNEAIRARRRAEDEAAMQQREERKAQDAWPADIKRTWKTMWNDIGEWWTNAMTSGRFNTGEGSNMTQEDKDKYHDASGAISRGDAATPIKGPSTQPFTGKVSPDLIPTASDADIIRVNNEWKDTMSENDMRIFFGSHRALIKKETGRDDWGNGLLDSQKFIDPKSSALGGFQVTLARLSGTDGTSILDTKFLNKYKDTYFGGVDWKNVQRIVNKYGGREFNAKAAQKNKDDWAVIEDLQKRWLRASDDMGFNAGVASSLRYDMVHDRFNDHQVNATESDKAKMKLLRNNLATLKGLSSYANLGGIQLFRNITRKILDSYESPEALAEAIKENNGLNVVETMFNAVNSIAPSGQIGNRYKTRDANGNIANELLEVARDVEGRSQNRAASNASDFGAFAENVFFNDKYDETTYSKDFNKKAGIRPDCSGFVSAAIDKYAKASGGELTAEMKEAVTQDRTAAGMLKAHEKSNGGKADYSADLTGLSKEEAAKVQEEMISTAKDGDVIYLGKNNMGEHGWGRHKDIGHVGVVVEENGEKYFVQKGKSSGKVLLRNALKWNGFFGYNSLYGISINSAFGKTGNVRPNVPTTQQPLGGDSEDVQKAMNEAEKERASLFEPSKDGNFGSYGRDMQRNRDAASWVAADVRKDLGDERLRKDLGEAMGLGGEVSGSLLDRVITSHAPGKEGGKTLLQGLLKDWRVFSDYKEAGRAEWLDFTRGFVHKLNPKLSESEVEKEADKLLDNEYFVRNMQATLMARYSGKDQNGNFVEGKAVYDSVDYGKLFTSAGDKASDEGVGPLTSRRKDRDNEQYNDALLTQAFDKVLGVDSHPILQWDPSTGKSKKVGEFRSGRFDDLDDGDKMKAYTDARTALASAMSEQKQVKGTTLKEGHYYEQAANLMNLYHLYKDNRYSDTTRKSIYTKLVHLAKSGKVSKEDLDALLSKGGTDADFATAFFKKAGLTSVDEENPQKLIQNISKLLDGSVVQEKDVDKLLHGSSITIGGKDTDRAMLKHQAKTAAEEVEQIIGGKYTDFHDKSKVSDSQAKQAIDLLRKKGYSPVADVLQKARANGTKIDLLELTRARNRSQPGSTQGNAPVVRPGEAGTDTGNGSTQPSSSSTSSSASGGVGPASGMFDPQVSQSLIQLNPTLTNLNRSIDRLNNNIEKQGTQPLNSNKNN